MRLTLNQIRISWENGGDLGNPNATAQLEGNQTAEKNLLWRRVTTYATAGIILSFALSCSQDFSLIDCVKGTALEAMQGGVTVQCTLPVQENWETKWISPEYAGSSKLG